MDSKLRRMAILSSMAVILLVSLLVLYINRPPGNSGNRASQATQSPLPQEDEGEQEARKPGQIGDDLSAFLRDNTFFDQEVNPVLEAAKDNAARLSLVVTSVEKDLRIQIVDTKGNPVTGKSFFVELEGLGEYKDLDKDGIIYIGDLPAGEYYANRQSQTMVVSLSMLVIFGILLIMISRMVDQKIVSGIDRITRSTQAIAGGDFGITIQEEGNPEFVLLSESINKMVENISRNMKENEHLLRQQESDMENSRAVIQNIKNACVELGNVSGETLENADEIYNGTGEQAQAVEDLRQIMDRLTAELSDSMDAAAGVTAFTENTAERIEQTQKQMFLLKDSMQKISEMSVEIEKIIGEINSIAQQTNMLSLNASIEAARAGEMGRGFAVVATQVGELAARSAQAAQETNELIMNSIRAVENGRLITDQTAEIFSATADNIAEANRGVEKIANKVRENVNTVADAVNQITRISSVVEKNVQISRNTREASSDMAEITGRLREMVD